MKVTVVLLKGESVEVDVSADDAVEGLKLAIEDAGTFGQECQMRVLKEGKMLNDDSTLRECGVRENDTLSLLVDEDLRGYLAGGIFPFDTAQKELRRLKDDRLNLWGRKVALAEELRSWDEDAEKRTGLRSSSLLEDASVQYPDVDAEALEQRGVRAVARRQVLEEHVEHKSLELWKVLQATHQLRSNNKRMAEVVQQQMQAVYSWADRIRGRSSHVDGLDPKMGVESLGRLCEARENYCLSLQSDLRKEREAGSEITAGMEADRQYFSDRIATCAVDAQQREIQARKNWKKERAQLLRELERVEARWHEKRFHVKRGSHFKEAKHELRGKIPLEEQLEPNTGISTWVRDKRAHEETVNQEALAREGGFEITELQARVAALEKKEEEEYRRLNGELHEVLAKAEKQSVLAKQKAEQRDKMRKTRDQLFQKLQQSHGRGLNLSLLSASAPTFKHTSANSWAAIRHSTRLAGALTFVLSNVNSVRTCLLMSENPTPTI